MKPIQLILIAVALVAAVGAGLMMMNLANRPEPQVVAETSAPVPTIPTVEVLIAKEDIPMGNGLTVERLAWEPWPQNNVRESFIIRDQAPEALEEYAKAIARSAFFAGEPIREQKIVRSDSGYLSAILPAGKRAVAVSVSASTSAGGFILPNDHVDVVMSYRNEEDEWITSTILTNVKVLAIDQVIEEQDGQKAKVGSTATLELTPDQTEVISVATQLSNRLTLALRSVEDAQGDETGTENGLLSNKSREKRGAVRLIRYGQSKEIQPKN